MTDSSLRRRLATVGLAGALLGGVLATLAPSPVDAAGTGAAATCSLTSTSGTVTKTIYVDGQGFRSYNLHVPAGLTAASPLLIDLHGLSSNAYFQEQTSGWSTYADAKKFIVAYPAGSAWGQSWDVNDGSTDATFIREVVKQIKSQYCVDAKRVYAEGGSLGGMMTQRMLCDAEDVFASGASTISAGYDYFGGGCSLTRGVAIAIFNNESDPLFPTSVSIATRDKWLAKDHCSTTGTPDPNPYGLNGMLYGGCDGGVHVLWRTYTSDQHAYPTGAALDDLHNKEWSFLMAHPHP